MFGRNYLRHCSSCVHKSEDNAHDKKKYEFLALKRLHVDGAKVFATAVSTAVFCIGLFHNELKKLKRDIKPLHDIFDFEKNLDSYIVAPNYLGNSPEVSTVKKYLKNLIESKSIWDVIPTRTLLKCTQSKDPAVKRKALEILSRRSCSEEADCLMISQSIDFPTSLYLARSSNIDRRFFRPPLKLPPHEQSVEAELTDLVEDVPRAGDAKKQQQFVQRMRKRKIRALSHIEKTVMLGFETFDDMGKDSQRSFELQVIVYLLQAILKYSEDDVNCKHLIGRGILTTLRRAYEDVPEDLVFISLITKILNNLILNGTNPKLFFETGWFHIILKWTESKCENVRLNATKLLVNMDLSCAGRPGLLYDNHVCLLHPTHRHHGPIEADVVFIHGIRGGPVKTWRQRDKKPKGKNNSNSPKNSLNNYAKEEPFAQNKNLLNSSENQNVANSIFIIEEDDDDDTTKSADYTQCWPKDWLPKDLHNVRILSVDYDTQLTSWASDDHIERKTLKEQAELLLDSLSAVGVGSRPVVLVGHSMGGLLIKQMLCMAAEKQMQLTNQVKGIVFYSVPHRGSYLINRTRNASYLIHPTDALLQLAEGSTDLKDLHEKFSDLMRQGSLKVRSFTEGESTNLPFYMRATIVSPQSSAPGFGDFFVMKDHDHVTICKPKSKDSLLYKLTRDFIRQCLNEY